ncbi:MAG: hypothetical protein ACI93T_002022 [Porticoccaceae bacterium]|jgi:hypothetical protein
MQLFHPTEDSNAQRKPNVWSREIRRNFDERFTRPDDVQPERLLRQTNRMSQFLNGLFGELRRSSAQAVESLC